MRAYAGDYFGSPRDFPTHKRALCTRVALFIRRSRLAAMLRRASRHHILQTRSIEIESVVFYVRASPEIRAHSRFYLSTRDGLLMSAATVVFVGLVYLRRVFVKVTFAPAGH